MANANSRLVIGGQAVIEGVMMRSPRWTSTAVRAPDGAIAVFTEARPSPLVRRRWLRLPVLRGVIALYDTLTIGVRSLLWSAGVAAGADRPLTAGQVGAAVAGGLVVAVGLFFVLPAALVRLVDRFLGHVYALNLGAGGRHRWLGPVMLLGLWLQRLTTREPDDRQVEVATRALREVVEREGASPSFIMSG